jgi:hypothetical protein
MANSQKTQEEAMAMLKDIDSRVEKIKRDLCNVDLLVNEDITDMFAQYSLGFSPDEREAYVNEFKEKHRKELRDKKVESLNRVREKLEGLKEKLRHDLEGSPTQDSALTVG